MVVPTTTTKKITMTPLASLSMALHATRHSTEAVHGVLLGYHDNNNNEWIVTDAVPITHGTPTLPIVEVALGLLPHCIGKQPEQRDSSSATTITTTRSRQIVGWYTAPMLLHDTQPDPLALRMMTNLAQAAATATDATTTSSTSQLLTVAAATNLFLVVVQNEALASFLNGTTDESSVPTTSFIKVYTKDTTTNQWLKPMDETTTMIAIPGRDAITVAMTKANDQGLVIADLLDFYDACSATTVSSSSSAATTVQDWYPNDSIAALLL